jgi:hypothetical protein
MCKNTSQRADSTTDHRVAAEAEPLCQPGSELLLQAGSCSLGQVGASAKEVRHKAERKIPGNAASIHAEGSKASSPLAGNVITK